MSNALRLFVFDDLSDHILARRTLEVAPVMIWFVGLDARKSHRRAASVAFRKLKFLR
jgi:hypothetical protein